MTRTICIYHANCADGFTAAWCVRYALGDTVEFIPAEYGSEPPDVAGAHVIIVDFSYKRPVLERMAQDARTILVLDHHKTAQADLAGMPAPSSDWTWQISLEGSHVALFDMDRSGAQMAWDFFCGGARRAGGIRRRSRPMALADRPVARGQCSDRIARNDV